LFFKASIKLIITIKKPIKITKITIKLSNMSSTPARKKQAVTKADNRMVCLLVKNIDLNYIPV